MTKKILLIIFLSLFPIFINAGALTEHKQVCKNIGFVEDTKQFADCVMKFYKKAKNDKEKEFLEKKEQKLAEEKLKIEREIADAETRQAEVMESERRRKRRENLYKALGLIPNDNTKVVVPRQKQYICQDLGWGMGVQCYWR